MGKVREVAADVAAGGGTSTSHLTIAQLRAVEAVARLGSFTQAAAELGVSQPTVSMQVRAVEDACRHRVFIRSGGAVTIARGASGLVAKVRLAVKTVNEVGRHIDAAASLQMANLSLGFSAHRIIMPIMRRLVADYPAIKLHARSGSSSELIDALECGSLDVAAVTMRAADARFVCHLISRKGLVVYGRKGHALCHGPSLDIRNLDGEALVQWNRGSHTRQAFEEETNRLGVRTQMALEVGSWDAAFASTAAGIGLGIALEGEVEPDDQVDVVKLTGGAFDVGQYLICLPECRDFAAVDAVFLTAEAFARDGSAVQRGARTHNGKAG